MESTKFIKSRNEALRIWERKELYRLESFQILDLDKIFNLQNQKQVFHTRKKYYKSFLKSFGQLKGNEVALSLLQNWFDAIKEDNHLTERTLAQIKCQLNVFFKWLEKESIIKENPLKNIRFKRNQKPRKNRRIFKSIELKELSKAADNFEEVSFFPFLYAIIHTGARRSEIMNLKFKDVDLQLKTITLNETKNGTSRTINISPQLVALISQKQCHSEYVFLNKYGKKLNRGYVQRIINNFKAKHKEFGDWNYHDLRHSFAYNFLKMGGEMYQLQALLGHKSIHMTIDLYGNFKSNDVEKPSPYDF